MIPTQVKNRQKVQDGQCNVRKVLFSRKYALEDSSFAQIPDAKNIISIVESYCTYAEDDYPVLECEPRKDNMVIFWIISPEKLYCVQKLYNELCERYPCQASGFLESLRNFILGPSRGGIVAQCELVESWELAFPDHAMPYFRYPFLVEKFCCIHFGTSLQCTRGYEGDGTYTMEF